MNFISILRIAAGLGALGTTAHAAQAPALTVYFGTGAGQSKGIYRTTFDPATGKLGAVELAAETGAPGFLALNPAGNRLYAVANFPGGPGAIGYRIKAGGALELINSSPTGDGGGAHIAVHPSGKFLLTAQYGNGSTALFPLDADGRLGTAKVYKHEGGSKAVPSRQDAPHAHWAGFSPDGKFALVPDLGMDGIVVYRVNLAGPTLEKHGFIASGRGSGPRHMRFSTDGKRIFLLNELTLTVTTYAWDAAAGTARQLSDVAALSAEAKAKEATNSAAEILVHPGGRFVYSSNRGHDSVTAYRADAATGALSVIQVQPIRGATPRNINLSPDGNWLLTAGQDSHNVGVHKVNPTTGELTFQPRSLVSVPSPICILFAKP